MLTGFNTNIRYRGVLFHVQSEDSGRDLPHIITHLYYGGTILFSEKSSYADDVDNSDLEGLVKGKMESQHKAVLKRLVGAQFDDVIRERLGAEIFADAEQATTQPAGPEAAAPEAPPPAEAADSADASGPRSFGDGIISEKPLDEVILSYLVENARKRKRPSG